MSAVLIAAPTSSSLAASSHSKRLHKVLRRRLRDGSRRSWILGIFPCPGTLSACIPDPSKRIASHEEGIDRNDRRGGGAWSPFHDGGPGPASECHRPGPP